MADHYMELAPLNNILSAARFLLRYTVSPLDAHFAIILSLFRVKIMRTQRTSSGVIVVVRNNVLWSRAPNGCTRITRLLRMRDMTLLVSARKADCI